MDPRMAPQAAATPSPEEVETKRLALEHQLEELVLTFGQLQDMLNQSPERVADKINDVVKHFSQLQTKKDVPIMVPTDVFRYLDTDRNPDLYTRDQLQNTAMRSQMAKAKNATYAEFHKQLQAEVESVFPGELGKWEEVKKIDPDAPPATDNMAVDA